MEELLLQFTIIILFTTLVSLVGRQLKLPLVLAYLLTGILIGYFGVHGEGVGIVLEVLSTLGVAFLLFLIGIELNITELWAVGAPSVAAGLGQIAFTAVTGWFIADQFGFSPIESLVIALALTFSSTIIAVKLLNTLGDIYSLYGRISIGILLVQDFVAIFVLILISLLQIDQGVSTAQTVVLIGGTLAKLGILGIVTYLFLLAGRQVFGYIAELSRKEESTELFLLAALSWVLAFTFISVSLDLSLEIGAFLAGLSLSGTGFSMEIVAKIKPLRDFFIILFFILLGSHIEFASFSGLVIPTVVFGLLVFLGNPLIVQFIMKFLGFSHQTNFLTGLTVSQIGEFSLIFAAGALHAGLVGTEIISMITVVAVITITLSSYAMTNGTTLFQWLRRPMSIIGKPRKETKKSSSRHKKWKDHIVIIGAGRVGEYIIDEAMSMGIPTVVVDYDPIKVRDLRRQWGDEQSPGWIQVKYKKKMKKKTPFEAIYGDVTDTDLFDDLILNHATLVISTINHFEDTLIVTEEVNRRAPDVEYWAVARFENETEPLEKAGVDRVIWPQGIARKYLGRKLREILKDKP